MTTNPEAPPVPGTEGEAQTPETTIVEASSNERLSQLHSMYSGLKAAADEANARLKTVTDAIKVELNSAAPTSTALELVGDTGPRLRLTYVTSMRLDSKRLKATDPATWARYAKESGSWTLKPGSSS